MSTHPVAGATRAILAAALLAAFGLPGTAHAEAELHGFLEGAFGARTAESSVHDDTQDFTLQETRAQLKVSAFGDMGEGFVRLDITNDHLSGPGTEVELREGFLRFTTLADNLDVKVGRQALTWGTGDLVFINDLFPKDWVSFFAGREDQYLKAPSDAIRLGFYGLPVDLDLVLTPEFTPDRFPSPGGRFSNGLPPGVGPPPEIPLTADRMEWALRASRYVGSFTASLYGYRGFYKTPLDGMRPNPGWTPVSLPDVAQILLLYPELAVYGASLRGPLPGGIGWVEGGWYDSREDEGGDDPLVSNSSLRYLAGYEKQIWTDFNLTLQYYGEKMLDYGDYETSRRAASLPVDDEFRHLWTIRAEQYLHYQTVRLSAFAFVSPTDEDGHGRLLVSYKVSDDVEVAVGANVFEGDSPMTKFGAFDEDDNVFTRLRYSF